MSIQKVHLRLQILECSKGSTGFGGLVASGSSMGSRGSTTSRRFYSGFYSIKLILVDRPQTGKSILKRAGPVKSWYGNNNSVTITTASNYFICFTLFMFFGHSVLHKFCPFLDILGQWGQPIGDVLGQWGQPIGDMSGCTCADLLSPVKFVCEGEMILRHQVDTLRTAVSYIEKLQFSYFAKSSRGPEKTQFAGRIRPRGCLLDTMFYRF